MKKVIAMVTLFCCLASLSACVMSLPIDTNYNSSTPSQTQETEVDKVLLDNDQMTATFQGVRDMPSLGVFYLDLKIVNKLDEEIVVSLESADVDGETIPLISTGVPLQIRPGNSGSTGFIFSMANLSIDTVSDAEKATFKIVLRSAENYDVLFESELIEVYLHK